MARKYTGSLSLEWFNKQKSILVQADEAGAEHGDVPAPKMNWINKDDALFYEIVDDEGRGLSPFWVDRSDLRVKEARPLVFQKAYKAVEKPKAGSLIDQEYKLVESKEDDPAIENILIRGDNLLALNALKKLFANRPDEEKVKCIYIDPPYNIGVAFEEYDDNLAHSEWLTLLRDRLTVLRELLREDGTIFVSIDNNSSSYLQILLDEIFGRQNRKNIITVKRGSVTGAKVINPGAVNVSEFVLIYAKNETFWKPNRVFRAKDRDERYNSFITNYDSSPEKWRYSSLLDAFALKMNIPKKDLKKVLGATYETSLDRFVLENIERVVQFAGLDEKNVSKEAVELKRVSEQDPTRTYVIEREETRSYYIYKGQRMLFAKDRLSEIDGELTFSEPITDIWDDVLPNDLHNEGKVEFRKSKKPEKLIERLFEMATGEGDLVLDSFGGSGTTFAVAQKMNRRWIGVEIGKHSDTHIIPRLKRVLTGDDQSGISKAVNWQGGGNFKYYVLGDSIIEPATRDFNWKLGRDFIEKSLLSSYDFLPDPEFSFPQTELLTMGRQPSIGFHRVGQRQMAGVVSLVEPKKDKPISYEELMNLYDALKKFKGTQSITVFTNRGVELAYDSKPEDLEVIKVPHAIFAELEK